MKIYCINLKRSIERREKMLAELKKLPLESEFIDAVDGRQLSESELKQAYSKWRTRFRFGRGLTAGEIGCALSHVKFYGQLLATEDKSAFVLEDDVTLTERAADALKEVQVFLEAADEPTLVELPGVERDMPMAADCKFVLVGGSMGTYAYGVNRAAAALLKEAFTPIKMPIDAYSYLVRKCGLKYYKYNEQVLTVDMAGESTIGTDRFFKLNQVQKIVFKFWRLIGKVVDYVLG